MGKGFKMGRGRGLGWGEIICVIDVGFVVIFYLVYVYIF